MFWLYAYYVAGPWPGVGNAKMGISQWVRGDRLESCNKTLTDAIEAGGASATGRQSMEAEFLQGEWKHRTGERQLLLWMPLQQGVQFPSPPRRCFSILISHPVQLLLPFPSPTIPTFITLMWLNPFLVFLLLLLLVFFATSNPWNPVHRTNSFFSPPN